MRLLLLTPCRISFPNEDKSYWCLYTCLLLSTECFVLHVIYKCMCLYIYTVVMPPIGIYLDFLLVTGYTMVDVLVVQIWYIIFATISSVIKVGEMLFCWILSKHKEEWRFSAVASRKYVITITSELEEFTPFWITAVQEFGDGSF